MVSVVHSVALYGGGGFGRWFSAAPDVIRGGGLRYEKHNLFHILD